MDLYVLEVQRLASFVALQLVIWLVQWAKEALLACSACTDCNTDKERGFYLVAFSTDLHQGSNDFSLGEQAEEAEAWELLREAVGRYSYTGTVGHLQQQLLNRSLPKINVLSPELRTRQSQMHAAFAWLWKHWPWSCQPSKNVFLQWTRSTASA